MYNIFNKFKYNKFSPSVNEWINSHYSFNYNNLNSGTGPTNILVYNLFNSYFNSVLTNTTSLLEKDNSRLPWLKNLFNSPHDNDKLEYYINNMFVQNMNLKSTTSMRTSRFESNKGVKASVKNCSNTLNRIFVSIPEIKYCMSNICVNLYIFNKERYLIERRLKTIKRKSYTKSVFNKFIHYNTHNNNPLFVDILSKKLIQTFFFRKFILSLYRNQFKFNVLKLIKIKHILVNLFNKHVILNIVNAKYLFVDNNILLEAIVRKLKNRKRRVLKVMRKAIALSKVGRIDPLLLIKPENNNIVRPIPVPVDQEQAALSSPAKGISDALFSDYSYINTTWNGSEDNIIFNLGNFIQRKNLKQTIFESLKNTLVVGIRLEANGRLSKRLTASRSVHKIAYYGNIQNIYSSKQEKSALISRGFLKSNVEYLNKNSYNRIGSYGIRSHVSTL